MKFRPIAGDDIKRLSARLGAKKTEIGFLFGWNNAQYYASCKAAPEQINPKTALMIRLLTDRPELSPIPVCPKPSEVFELITAVWPQFTLKEFTAMIGLSASHANELIDDMGSVRPVTGNYLLAIKKAIENQSTKKGKLDEISYFMGLAEREAGSRGIPRDRLWTACWRPKPPAKTKGKE